MTLRQRLHRGVRVFLKHTLNPLTRRLARRSWGPFSLVRHVGRRSGQTYETPLIVARVDGGFVIALTYGPNVDWYKNVQAAGGCTLVWRGGEYGIDRIEPLDAAAGWAAFPAPPRWILRALGRRHFVRMTGPRPLAAVPGA